MKSILIVDDEEILRFTFGEFLEEGGYEVQTAENYDDAMEKLGDFQATCPELVPLVEFIQRSERGIVR